MSAGEEHDQTGWDYRFVELDSGCGDGISVTIYCNRKKFIVQFSPVDSLQDAIEGPLIERYEAASEEEDEEEEEAVQQELDDLIFNVGRPIFAQLAPPNPPTAKVQPVTLHSLLYPETIHLQFATVDGEAKILEQDVHAEQHGFEHAAPPPIQLKNDLGLPTHLSTDIQVLEEIQGQGEITHVLVDGRERCCKSGEPFNWKAIEREFDCLGKITQSKHGKSIQIPKLTGLVTSPDGGQIIGILEEYVPTDREKLATLRDVDPSVVAVSRRRKWASQIQRMVDSLHEIGIVWGDGKPANVLIHKDTDDAWLIDFGGSWTDDWVDEEFMETQEGDEQAVGRIFDFLHVARDRH
jgi:serine/threonine protein kinase